MTRKLTNREIVGEAMYSVRNSLNANVPPPPTKTLNQMVNENRYKVWQERKAQEDDYNAAVAASEDRSRAEGGRDDNAYNSVEEARKNKITFALAFLFAVALFCILTQITPLFEN